MTSTEIKTVVTDMCRTLKQKGVNSNVDIFADGLVYPNAMVSKGTRTNYIPPVNANQQQCIYVHVPASTRLYGILMNSGVQAMNDMFSQNVTRGDMYALPNDDYKWCLRFYWLAVQHKIYFAGMTPSDGGGCFLEYVVDESYKGSKSCYFSA